MKNLIFAIIPTILFFTFIFLLSYLMSFMNKEWYFIPTVITGVLSTVAILIFAIIRWFIYSDDF